MKRRVKTIGVLLFVIINEVYSRFQNTKAKV